MPFTPGFRRYMFTRLTSACSRDRDQSNSAAKKQFPKINA